MVKILLVDDHKIILDSLSVLLKSVSDFEVVGALENPKMVLPFLAENEIDVIILDCNMPEMTGIDLMLAIKEIKPSQKVLLLTMMEDATHIKEAIQAGVSGYILKKTNSEELESAVRQVLSGKKYYSQQVIDELAHIAESDLINVMPEHIFHLTSREIELIRLIAGEMTSNEIAEKLFISLATVETHRANIMKKLQVKSSIGVTKFAIKHKLIE